MLCMLMVPAAVMIRLMLVLSPAASLLAGVGASALVTAFSPHIVWACSFDRLLPCEQVGFGSRLEFGLKPHVPRLV